MQSSTMKSSVRSKEAEAEETDKGKLKLTASVFRKEINSMWRGN